MDDYPQCLMGRRHQRDDLVLYITMNRRGLYILLPFMKHGVKVHLQVSKPIEFYSHPTLVFHSGKLDCFVNCLPAKSVSDWNRDLGSYNRLQQEHGVKYSKTVFF